MAGSLNRVTLIGNLGKDPELKHIGSGKAVCNLSLATNETWKDKQSGEKKEKVEWHRITAWGDLAENCAKYLTKGRSICVEGKIETESYEDKEGVKKYSTKIIASNIVFLGGDGKGEGKKESSGRESSGRNGGERNAGPPVDDDDSIPF